MRVSNVLVGAVLFCVGTAGPLFAKTAEDFRNEKVAVSELTLAPGEQEQVAAAHVSVLVYLAGDEAQIQLADGQAIHESIVRGRAVRVESAVLRNTGHEPLHIVRVEFLTEGSGETWGMAGLPPNYKVLFEDRHSRTYEIRIAPHAWEPQHTHHARVVVCLSGAQLEHVLPDGTKQPSTLKTDEVTWRPAQTHTGHNLGDTELWCIAIEPK
jgi:hypothetical protein